MTGVQTSSSSPLSLSSKTVEVPFSTTSKLTKIRVGRELRADAGLSLGDLMLTSLRKWQHCSKPSQIDAHFGTTMSFRELLLQTIYAAEGFKAMGLAPNDVLAVVSWNRHEMFSAVLGAVCAGLTVACIVPSSTQAEMQHALTLTQAKVVISEPDRIGTAMAAYPGVPHVVLTGQPPDGAKTFLNILRMGEATQPRPDPDTYRAVELGDRSQHAPVILFSSGTTGLPKAVMLRDSSLTLTLANTSAGSSVDEGKASDAMLLLTSPLCWFSGVMNLFWSLQTGSTRVFITHSDDLAVLSAIDKYKVCPLKDRVYRCTTVCFHLRARWLTDTPTPISVQK